VSAALFVFGGTITFDAGTILGGTGGDGSQGGAGFLAGGGGRAGSAGGAQGGDGGFGAPGSGGAGGNGGSAIGVATAADGKFLPTSVAIYPGTGGQPGDPGSGGVRGFPCPFGQKGVPGVAVDIQPLPLRSHHKQ
jgi:hypothetical protein